MYRPQRAFRWSDWSTVDRIAVVSLLAAAMVEIVSIIVLPVEGYDASYHLFWMNSWHTLWQHGVFYPRWLPRSFGGLGGPTFYLYPPLAYACSSVIGLFAPGFTIFAIAKLFVILTLAASGATMWYYLRSRGLGSVPLALGTLLYVFAPYRFLDFNTRSALSEHFAFVFLPVVFLGADRVFDPARRASGFLMLSISMALLTLTSLPAAAVMVVVLIIYAIASKPPAMLHNDLWLAKAGLASTLLAAFYLIPMLASLGNVQLDKIWSAIGPGSPLVTLAAGNDLRIGAYTTLTFLGACLLLYFFWRARKDNARPEAQNSRREWWLLAVIVVFQLPYLPVPLFTRIIPFTIIQQPYRLSMPLLVLVAAWWSSRLDGATRLRGTSLVVAGWSVAIVCLVSVQLFGFQVHAHTPIRMSEVNELPTRWMPDSPKASGPVRVPEHPTLTLSDSCASILSFHHGDYSDTAVYESSSPCTATFPRTYWPAWSVRLDGRSIEAWPDSVGRLTLRIPSGRHTITARLDETTHERVGMWISIATLIALFLFTFFYPTEKVTPTDP